VPKAKNNDKLLFFMKFTRERKTEEIRQWRHKKQSGNGFPPSFAALD
jgi:hypothetical protein